MASLANSRRNSLSLNPTPSPAPSQYSLRSPPEDDYDYHDTGPSHSPTNPKQSSGNPNSADASDDPEHFVDAVRTNILEKAISSNRAKLPDDFGNANGILRAPSGQASASAAAVTSPKHKSLCYKRKRRAILNASRTPITGTVPRSADKTILRKVDLHWAREEDSGIGKVSLSACIPNNNAFTGSENSVLWQHSNYENIRLEELEDLLTNLQIHGLQESEIGLTKRLINWTRQVSERSFVHGRFLIPTAIRYDMLDDSRYNKDRCSIFLGFPYFAVKKQEEKPSALSKGEPQHPARTLLQSRYRLNETTERDESQCITELTGDKLKSCIKASDDATAHLTRQKVEELIYVPQLWALIIGLDRMITAGPIEDIALRGSTLMLKDTNASGAIHSCSFVRISFINRGVVESQIYPISQCSSWFGLLNIHQQLRSVLKQGKEKAAPKDFKLRIGPHTLTGGSWASAQQSTDAEILNIWMDTPKLPIVSVQDTDGNIIAKQQDAQNSDTESLHKAKSARTARDLVCKELDPAPVIRPFLEWLVLDDFGNRDESTPEVRVKRFLSAIYHSLSASCASQSTAAAPQAAQTPSPGENPNQGHTTQAGQTTVASQNPRVGPALQSGLAGQSGRTASSGLASGPGQTPPTGQTSQASQSAPMLQNQTSGIGTLSIFVTGKTSKNVDDLTYELIRQTGGNDTIIGQRLRKETAKLFKSYVPATHDETLAPVRLFWGLLYELIEHHQHLQVLHEQIQDINKWTQRLHLGVYYQRRTVNDTGAVKLEDAISDNAILQATMIDALGAVFNMLEAAVRESRSSNSTDPCVEPYRRALRHGKEASNLLREARDKLIAEATGSAPGQDLGPVITPEPIMIMLLERLAHGVYGSGTVDVINIFEECLEQLALDVEKRPSRRLLKKINAFQEEVDIVNSVLLQQHKVLIQFRTCLDPAEFKRPSIARKMRFKFEESGIERVITHLKDQRRYCKELSDRAKVLADQNVRLVETLADDNSRAIFIFTFITILFLPLSFVATFFGMNVVGINPTTSTTSHFWYIGAPLTGGIMVICMVFVFKGEDVWFFLADLPASFVDLLK